MRIVVTGGGGYVGYHVGWALSRGGHHVTLLDLSPPDPEWTSTAPRALWDALPPGFWGEKLPVPGPLEFVKGSVTNPHDLQTHFEGAAAVVHTASYGMSGREQLPPHAPQQEKVNIEGTREVIQAALTAKVRALVYTSTYNVVFGGCEIVEGDETMPLFPLHAHTDHYSRTKAIAEMLVLMADGKCGPPAMPSSGTLTATEPHLSPLRTCSLRMNGVMGLGEKRHSCRIISAIRSGLLIFAYGRKDGLIDFIGIQNVVQAHVKALMGLLREQSLSTQDTPAILPSSGKILGYEEEEDSVPISGDSSSHAATSSTSSVPNKSHRIASRTLEASSQSTVVYKSKDILTSTAISSPFSVSLSHSVPARAPSLPSSLSGQAFFISDAAPVSHFEYFQPLFEGLGYSFPALTLPLWVILAVAYTQAFLYCLVHRFFPFSPFVTPAEAYKSGVTHYCSNHKAMDAFSYSPTRPNDLKQMVEYYRARGCTNKMGLVSVLPVALFFLLPIFILLIVI